MQSMALASLADERNGAYLYDALSKAEKDERLAEVYHRMADAERKHAASWTKRLNEAGVPIPAAQDRVAHGRAGLVRPALRPRRRAARPSRAWNRRTRASTMARRAQPTWLPMSARMPACCRRPRAR